MAINHLNNTTEYYDIKTLFIALDFDIKGYITFKDISKMLNYFKEDLGI